MKGEIKWIRGAFYVTLFKMVDSEQILGLRGSSQWREKEARVKKVQVMIAGVRPVKEAGRTECRTQKGLSPSGGTSPRRGESKGWACSLRGLGGKWTTGLWPHFLCWGSTHTEGWGLSREMEARAHSRGNERGPRGGVRVPGAVTRMNCTLHTREH